MTQTAPWMSKPNLMLWLVGYAAVIAIAGGLIWWWFRLEFRNTIILIVACISAFVIFGGTMYSFLASHQARDAMLREGLKGTARVLQVESTNVLINRRPQVRMRLEVSVPGKRAYELAHVDTIPLGQALAPGRELTIYLDRKHPQRLMIDWNAPIASLPAASSAAPSTVSTRLQELQRLRDERQISEDEYQAQRQRILSDL